MTEPAVCPDCDEPVVYAFHDTSGVGAWKLGDGFNTSGHVRYGEESISDTWIRGLTPSMAPILDLDLTSGRMVNENDEENRSQVGVIGTDIVIRFASINAAQCAIQATGSPLGTWTDVLTGIPGTGGVVTVTNFGGAGLLPRFFRVKLLLP